MKTMSRRDVVRSAGLAFAGPVAVSVFPNRALGQALPESPVTLSIFNPDLAKYASSGVGPVIKAARNGSISHTHLERAASCSHLFARHMETLQGNQQFATNVAQADYESCAAQLPAFQSLVATQASQYDSTFQNSDSQLLSMTSDQFSVAKSQLTGASFSDVFHKTARNYHAAAKHLANGNLQSSNYGKSRIKPATWEGTEQPRLVYGYDGPARMVQACDITPEMKKYLCDNLHLASDFLTFAGLAAVVVCGIAIVASLQLEGALICSYGFGASVALHAAAIAAISDYLGC